MTKLFLSAIVFFSFSNVSFAEVKPSSTAPEFKLVDLKGSEHKLSEWKGKWIVMEWFNKDCPFVKKHYGSNNMQNLQKTYTDKGVVWLTINSSNKGNQGYEVAADALKTQENLKTHNSFFLMDTDGTVGKMYGAQTTPQMVVINPEQKVIYTGAIDSNPSPDASVIASSTNYVAAALDSAMNGKAVAVAHKKSYGCGVKY